jgi:hypothetical protein
MPLDDHFPFRLRTLRASTDFATTAVLVRASGIGASVAISAWRMRCCRVRCSEGFRLRGQGQGRGFVDWLPAKYSAEPIIFDWKQRNHVFTGTALQAAICRHAANVVVREIEVNRRRMGDPIVRVLGQELLDGAVAHWKWRYVYLVSGGVSLALNAAFGGSGESSAHHSLRIPRSR